nr:hypothetical protein [Tanacetum cinerariifolium]
MFLLSKPNAPFVVVLSKPNAPFGAYMKAKRTLGCSDGDDDDGDGGCSGDAKMVVASGCEGDEVARRGGGDVGVVNMVVVALAVGSAGCDDEGVDGGVRQLGGLGWIGGGDSQRVK